MAWIIDFNTFFHLYLYNNAIGALVILVYLYKIGELHIDFKVRIRSFSNAREMIRFGLYTVFNQSINMVVRMIDLLMLTYYAVTGLAAAGIYDFGMLVVNVINVPAQGIRQIASPVVADAFKRNDMSQLESIYKKTCNNLLIAGLFIFSVVVINLHSLFGSVFSIFPLFI